jgi:hypothetical protein
MPDLIYVYCVMNRMPVLEHLAVSELPDTLVHDGLYAVVGRVPAEDFSEENLPVRLQDPVWITHRVTLHERVVEHAMQSGCVVPLKFGTVFKSEETAHAMLEANATGFRQKLSELAGKEEWGVKIYCDRRRLAESVAAQEPALAELDRELASAPRGRAFLVARRRRELSAAAVNREVARLGQVCFERLLEQCLKARVNDRLKPEATGRSEEMILNGAFLVRKDVAPEFFRTVSRLGAQFGPRGLVFEPTGPWPPYNFCEFDKESAQLG